MNEKLVQENKAKLLAEKKRIKSVLGHEAKFDGAGEFPGDYKPEFHEVGNEQGENASEVEQFANDLGVTGDLEARLSKVEAALARIQNNTYGKCPGGDEIEENRLRAEPAAETCIKHAK